MSAVGWLLVAAGGVLVWAGIRDENAVQLVTDVFSGSRKLGTGGQSAAAAKVNAHGVLGQAQRDALG